jgi:hypothetical protein
MPRKLVIYTYIALHNQKKTAESREYINIYVFPFRLH